jgi:hypothetical protein
VRGGAREDGGVTARKAGGASKPRRLIPFVVLVVLSFFAVRAVAGDPIQGFMDGLVAGFTDDV